MTEALLGFVAVFVMAFLRIPLAVAMADWNHGCCATD